MSPRARRLLLIALGVVVAWYAAVVVWAVRPSDDTVPVGNMAAWETLPTVAGAPAPLVVGEGEVVVQRVRCNAIVDGSARDGAPPDLPFPRTYNREPCTLAHSNGRLIFVLDTVVVAAVLIGVVVVVRRTRRRGRDDDDAVTATAGEADDLVRAGS